MRRRTPPFAGETPQQWSARVLGRYAPPTVAELERERVRRAPATGDPLVRLVDVLATLRRR